MPVDKSWQGYAKGTYKDEGYERLWQDAIPADEPGRMPPVITIPFGYQKETLRKGWQKTPANRPLDLDIIFEKDVEIVLRDGVTVWARTSRDDENKLMGRNRYTAIFIDPPTPRARKFPLLSPTPLTGKVVPVPT
jgi:hypothetical protein